MNDKKLTICLVSSGFPPEDAGGIGTYIHNLSAGLHSQGHKVVVITKSKEQEGREDFNGVTVYRYKTRYIPKLEKFLPGLAWSRFVAKTISALDKEFRFDIIEFPNWEGVGFVYLLKRGRKPVAVRVHTPYFETLSIDSGEKNISWGDRFICWLEEQSCRKADTLVSSTVCHQNLIVNQYHLNAGQIKILPLGIDLQGPEITTHTSNGMINVLYVSRLEKRKGTLTLLNAIPRIAEEIKNVRFTIIGRDRPHAPDNRLYKEFFEAEHPGQKDRVNFLGFISSEELERHYQKSDVFVVPSVYESFGLIYVEAMKYGKPVIGCWAGGIPEVIDEGKTGFLVEPNDEQGLAEKVITLLKDEGLRRQMGAQARRHCEEKFSRQRMASDTARHYADTIGKRDGSKV